MKTRCLKILFWTFLSLGLLLLVVGISLPLFLNNLINERLKDVWLSPDNEDYWTKNPGKNDITINRSYRFYNITNVDEVLNYGTPKIMELPEVVYRESAQLLNWTYQDASGKSYNQTEPEDFVAYNLNASVTQVPGNLGISLPLDANITSVNFKAYLSFYGMTHANPVLYMVPMLYTMVNALEKDLYMMVLAYTAFTANISNTDSTTAYLTGLGFPAALILKDPLYGWGSWKTLKIWIQCLIDYSTTQSYNSYENLQTYFQLPNLLQLIVPGSLLYELVTNIQLDMLARYRTNDPKTIGDIQWATGGILANLPLGLGQLNIPNAKVPFPSYLMLNSSFSAPPEIFWFQYVAVQNVSNRQVWTADIPNLLNISYSYPRQNYKSLLNFNNLVTLFSAPYEVASAYFNFSNPLKVNITQGYMSSIVALALPKYNITTVDGYSTVLAKLSRQMIVPGVINLRDDSYWTVPTVLVFLNFTEQELDCNELILNLDYENVSICDSNIGWTYQNSSSWTNFMVWVKASIKGPTSYEYQNMLNYLPSETLQSLISFLYVYSDFALKVTKTQYGCSKVYCTYEELLFNQWSTSFVTLNPPLQVQSILSPSKSMQTWWPSHYQVPIEWTSYSKIPLNPTAASNFLSYDAFLNPSIIRLYLNSYYQGNTTNTMITFNLPVALIIPEIYNYLIGIIPGLSFFATRPMSQWINGYQDPLVQLIKNMSFYDGGLPTSGDGDSVIKNISTIGQPQSVVYSGRLDQHLTKKYYKQTGLSYFNTYAPAYNEYSQSMQSYQYLNPWSSQIPVSGCDGILYGSDVSKTDVLGIFFLQIFRPINLTYVSEKGYYDLNVLQFSVQQGLMNTSESVPQNLMYSQGPSGYDGFFNLSGGLNAPVYIGFQHCYMCSDEAVNMTELYPYSADGTLENRILPTQADAPFVFVEPVTGVAVQFNLSFDFKLALFNDYFFTGFSEGSPGKGLYLPVFEIVRFASFSKHQINSFFGEMLLIQEVRKIVFYVGVILGCALIIFAILIGVKIYKRGGFLAFGERAKLQDNQSLLIDIKNSEHKRSQDPRISMQTKKKDANEPEEEKVE